MLDCVAAVACVVMGFEATEDRKAAAREGGDEAADEEGRWGATTAFI